MNAIWNALAEEHKQRTDHRALTMFPNDDEEHCTVCQMIREAERRARNSEIS